VAAALRAFSCTIDSPTFIVIKADEAGLAHALRIVVDLSFFELFCIVLDCHVEDTVLLRVYQPYFFLKLVCPLSTGITPSTLECLCSPWVSDLDETLFIGEGVSSKNCECVTHDKAMLVSYSVVASTSSASDDVFLAVVSLKLFPQGIRSCVYVSMEFKWSTDDSSHST